MDREGLNELAVVLKLLGTNQASAARFRPSMKRERGRAEKKPILRADATGSGSGPFNGLYKAEVIHRRGPWRSFETVEFVTLGATTSPAEADIRSDDSARNPQGSAHRSLAQRATCPSRQGGRSRGCRLSRPACRFEDRGRPPARRSATALPEREVMTGIGPVAVRQPRVRDRKAGAADPVTARGAFNRSRNTLRARRH
ncbi:hypothetical protein GWG67_33000 [Bradyrhizobium sp. CSS354]|nr:hypothetical protein [Bradyrhizobium sp. CSS354]